MIPFFHSLQYLLFVVALKKNQATAEAINSEMDDASRHTTFFWSFWGFLLWSLLLGGLSFSILPTVLQNLAPTQSQVLGSTFWFFAFGIFINIHHYFIDNVIWRGDNEQVKTHLVQASQV
jgi:hypothetical protein